MFSLILSRLRQGTCTKADKNILDLYVLTSDKCSPETKALTDITRWVTDPTKACPLITYRDAHNFESSKAFAQATGQDFNIYHAFDTRGRGRNKKKLTGLAAEAAWRVRVKDANDLGGKVPFIPGMPVFGTDNIATELGLSKGSMGTLVSIKYEVHEGRQYAISATVDFTGYNSVDSEHPH